MGEVTASSRPIWIGGIFIRELGFLVLPDDDRHTRRFATWRGAALACMKNLRRRFTARTAELVARLFERWAQSALPSARANRIRSSS